MDFENRTKYDIFKNYGSTMKQLVNDRYDREIVEYTCTQVLVAIPNVHFFHRHILPHLCHRLYA